MANHDPRPLLEEILKVLRNNDIKNHLTEITHSLKKQTVPPKQSKIQKFWSVIKNFLAPGVIVSIAIFTVNSINQKVNSPLEYSLNQIHSVDKLISPDGEAIFTLSPFAIFQLDRNNGGQMKNLFLIVFNDKNDLQVYSPIVNKNYSYPYNNLENITMNGEPLLIWNPTNDTLGICLTDIYLEMTRTKAASAFLVVKGQNGTYSIITLLHKIGNKSDNYKDSTLSFTDLEIYDKRVWKEQVPSSSYTFFIKEYDFVTKNYQTVVTWIKNTTL